jgi:putative endonuclease
MSYEPIVALSGTKCRRSADYKNSKFMSYAVYILKCSDGTYYTGLTKDLDVRLLEHETGLRFDAYTYGRRPLKLVWSVVTESYQEAFRWERKIKGWSRAKKEALIRGDIEGIHEIVKNERKRKDQKRMKANSRAKRNKAQVIENYK